MNATREQRIEQALFRGGTLTIENPNYRDAVGALTKVLLRGDLAQGDLTVKSLGIEGKSTSACILTRDGGVAAGLAEMAFLMENMALLLSLHDRRRDAAERRGR